MRPAWSVLLLTTLIGAGQGLFLALAGAELLSYPERNFMIAGAALSPETPTGRGYRPEIQGRT
jgi:hypothetical protein